MVAQPRYGVSYGYTWLNLPQDISTPPPPPPSQICAISRISLLCGQLLLRPSSDSFHSKYVSIPAQQSEST